MDLIDAHLDHLAYLGYRPGTIYQRRRCLRRAELGVGDLMAATGPELYGYVSALTIGAEALAGTVSHLRAFFRWALIEGHGDSDPTVRLERPRRPRHLPRPMPRDELERAIAQAEEPIRAQLHLAAFGGLRCCEIAALRGEDRHGDVLVIREQKGGDEGAIPVGPVLSAAVAHLPARGWWFPRRDHREGPMTAGQLQRHANRYLHDLGISHTMHTLRHRFISDVYQASGRDLRVTQELARHRSITSTVGYTWVDPGDGHAIVALIG